VYENVNRLSLAAIGGVGRRVGSPVDITGGVRGRTGGVGARISTEERKGACKARRARRCAGGGIFGSISLG
jgi:hypothetical protein